MNLPVITANTEENLEREDAKRVLFINPPSPFLLDEKVFPNLAPIFVATAMKDRGHHVDILDLSGEEDYLQQMEEFSRKDYHVFAFTGTSAQFSHNIALLDVLKRTNPSTFAVIGGPHASVVSNLRNRAIESWGDGLGEGELENMLNDFDPNFSSLEKFDAIIEGEGEVSYPLMFSKGPQKWRKGEVAHFLDGFPLPDRSMIDIESYRYEIDGKKATSIMTQRGCPFGCYFCSGRDTEMYRRVKSQGTLRINSPERVVQEMDYLNGEFGFEAFMWYDDEINLHNDKLRELAELLGDRPYKHRGFVKSELFVKWPEQAELLAKAGFVELCTGAESGSERILKDYIRKNTTAETNREAIEIAHKNGIRFKVFTMLGHPTETYEDVMMTRDWILNSGTDDFDITIHQPYPGAPVYDCAVKDDSMEGYSFSYRDGLFFNKTDYSREINFYKGVPGEYVSSVRTNELTADQIVGLRDEIDETLRDMLGLKKNRRSGEVAYGGSPK